MFRTEITVSPSPDKITLENQILCLGSCFADHIGNRLKENKFLVNTNPGGIIYNPISLLKLFDYALTGKTPSAETYLNRNSIFYNYDFHSRLNSEYLDALKEEIQKLLAELQNNLTKSKWIILTLGTAVIYKRKSNGEIVANCHKVPSGEFTKEMLSQKQILAAFQSTYTAVKKLNPEVQFLLSVSPVRHLKETFNGNSVSKSILRITCDTLANGNNDIHYFPAYEIMMDDLRDYRFYDRDLIHPSEVAVDYIWEKFVQAFMSEDTLTFLATWNDIRKDLLHRSFNPHSESHRLFLENLAKKLKGISNKVDVSEELKKIQKDIDG